MPRPPTSYQKLLKKGALKAKSPPKARRATDVTGPILLRETPGEYGASWNHRRTVKAVYLFCGAGVPRKASYGIFRQLLGSCGLGQNEIVS